MQNSNVAFTLRLRLYRNDKRAIIVRVYDDLGYDARGAIRLTYEVRHGGKIIFPKGQLTSALSPGQCSDSVHAKELVLSHIAMHPGSGHGVGGNFYEGYTEEQIAWCKEHGEAIDMARSDRYCDPKTGFVRD